MKLINYKCNKCGREIERICQDSEWKNMVDNEEYVDLGFCECGGTLKRFNFKNNKQNWKFFDER